MRDPFPSDRNAAFARVLLIAARWLVVVPVVLTVVLLSAGTFLVPDLHRAIYTLGFKSLAMVSYDGIVSINAAGGRIPNTADGPNYLFTLHQFPNAFSWTCDRCPAVIYTDRGFVKLAEVAQSGPHTTLDPMNLMLDIGLLMSGRDSDDEVTACYRNRENHRGGNREKCGNNTFFNAWVKSYDFPAFGQGLPIPLSFILHVSAIAVALMALSNEVLISLRPGHMRCRCLLLKRWCPYPKGTAAEVAALPPHTWDRVRVSVYGIVLAYFVLPAFNDTVMPAFFVRYLQFIDRYLPEDQSMKPRQNAPYMVLLWADIASAALAFFLVVWRWRVTRPKGYISLDDLAALEQPEDGASAPLAAADDEAGSDDEDDASESGKLLPPVYSETREDEVQGRSSKVPSTSVN